MQVEMIDSPLLLIPLIEGFSKITSRDTAILLKPLVGGNNWDDKEKNRNSCKKKIRSAVGNIMDYGIKD